MKQVAIAERVCLIGHLAAMAFGLAGLLIVLPNPQFIAMLTGMGQTLFRWGMTGGGAVYMIFGAAAAAIYAYRHLGLKRCLTFLIPAVVLSLGSELLGTSTGFPFGHYGYLDGLGYKIAGLVPFTIPLSWFYLGFAAYVLARSGLEKLLGESWFWVRQVGAVVLGAVLLTAWDIVLDFAMSQDSIRFWEWQQSGAFYGMPYQNFAGWLGTGSVFMTVAACFWGRQRLGLSRGDLVLPLIVYLINFSFGAVITLAAGIWIPCLLATAFGLVPAVVLWWIVPTSGDVAARSIPVVARSEVKVVPSSVGATSVGATSVSAAPKVPVAPLSSD